MSKPLIIVESPTKARTLARFLGDGFSIEASMGHVRDLPKAKLGVDVEKDFEPQYVIPKDKRKTVENLKEISKKAKEVILATDPDREGEAIAWHISFLATEKKADAAKLKRIVFHEITKEAIEEALEKPRTIDIQLVDAQQARRVLDRLVGYKLSPLLWFKVKKGLSAGRVQSIAVRLIVEREREIEAFKPLEYWSVEALLSKPNRRQTDSATGDKFVAVLIEKEGKKIDLKNESDTKAVVGNLEKAAYRVLNVSQRESKKSPYPPFTTSTLTQAASNRFGYTAKKTMKLAQDLYEEGFITYHRTDSVNLAPSILTAAKNYIEKTLGKEYLPEGGLRVYKTKSKVAQEAHEAIRPTKIEVGIEQIVLGNDHKKLYKLIWDRFIASQLADTIYDHITLDVQADKYLLRASGSIIKFAGWLKVYGREEGDTIEEKKVPLLKVGDSLKLDELMPQQHFTQPPPRYTEASLIKAMEEKGIGRPSTYAPIISTILDRNYVEREERKFKPTPLGVATNDFLVKGFPKLIDAAFTAKMEDSLDSIANGEVKWVPVIKDFFGPFQKDLDNAYKNDRVKVEAEATDELCPDGHHLVIRYGRFGKFLACEKFPDHKFTKNFEEKIEAICPDSGDPVVVRRTRKGRPFFGCSAYPKCKWMSWKNPALEQQTPAPANPVAEA